MSIKQKIVNSASTFKQNGFNGTSNGKHISLAEFLAYSVGGMGVTSIFKLTSYIALAANCLLLGSVYGIRPTHLTIMYICVTVFNVIKTPIISMLIDNTNTKYGKFRPFLIWSGVPTIILLSAMPFVPVDINYTLKCVLLAVIFALTMMFQTLHFDAFRTLAQVMTPNPEERATFLSLSQVIYNLAPSIIGLLFPILAVMISPGEKGGLLDINVYRILFPAISIPSMILTLWTFKSTSERIIVPKDYVSKVKFSDGMSQICKNKYFWILTISDVLGVFRYNLGIPFLTWYCVYHLENQASLGLFTLLLGNASLPGMLLAPILIKKLGLKNAQLFDYAFHTVFAIALAFVLDSPILFMICLYLCTLGVGADFTIRQSMLSDIFDYQQYKTGKRIEGFITQFVLTIATTIGIVTAPVLPMLQEHYGLIEDYNVLFDPTIRENIFLAFIWTTAISSILAMVPFFFYNLDKKKHREILTVLEARAAQGDGESERQVS